MRKQLRVLWVARASTVSVLAGCGLALVGQVHDLYLDFAGVAAPAARATAMALLKELR